MTQKLLTASSVAGNVATDFTAPSGNKYRMLYAHLKLTTDATVANRLVKCEVYDDSDAFVFDIHCGAYITASLTNQHVEFMPGIYRESALFAGTIQVPVPMFWVIKPGWYFKFSIDNGQAGDSYTVNAVMDELAEGSRV